MHWKGVKRTRQESKANDKATDRKVSDLPALRPLTMSKRSIVLFLGVLISWSNSEHIEPVFFEICLEDGTYDSLKVQGWKLVSLVAAGSGYDIYSAWQSSSEKNDTDCDVTRVLTGDTSNPSGMTSSFVDRFWNRVEKVRVSVYRNGTETAFVNFKGSKSKSSWFSSSNIIDSFYTDLSKEESNYSYFSMAGNTDNFTRTERRFMIWKSLNTCEDALGWMMVSHVRKDQASCPAENGTQPIITYSPGITGASETDIKWTFYENSLIWVDDIVTGFPGSVDECKAWCVANNLCGSVDLHVVDGWCCLNFEGASPIDPDPAWNHYQLERLETISCSTVSNSNSANVNITYNIGDVNITCDAGHHVTGQALTSVSQMTRCQLDGTLTEPVSCTEPRVVLQPHSELRLAVDGKLHTCIALPPTYSTHHINMCVGSPIRGFDFHINATDYGVCDGTKVSMRDSSDVMEEDPCESGRAYWGCQQYERCTYSCQYNTDVVCADIFLRIRPVTETGKLCEIEISFP